MKLKHLIMPAVGLVALLAVACDGGDTIVQNTNQGATGISATGTGRASGEPDVAIVSVGVNVQRETVEEARNDAAEPPEAGGCALRTLAGRMQARSRQLERPSPARLVAAKRQI